MISLNDIRILEMDKKKLEEIEELLNAVGITFNYDTKSKISLSIDEEILRKTIKRNAGRHRKHLNFIKIGEVYKMRESMTDEEICKQLGIGKATFYRRLKTAERLATEVGAEEALQWNF